MEQVFRDINHAEPIETLTERQAQVLKVLKTKSLELGMSVKLSEDGTEVEFFRGDNLSCSFTLSCLDM